MWAGIKGILGKQPGDAGTGISTLRVQNGKMTSTSKGIREVLVRVEHSRKLGIPTAIEAVLGRGEHTQTHENGKTVIQAFYREISQGREETK